MNNSRLTSILIGLLCIACNPKSEESSNIRWITCEEISTGDLSDMKGEITKSLQSRLLSNRVLAVEILMKQWEVLREAVHVELESMLIQAAISVRNIGNRAKTLVEMIQQEVDPKIAGGRYKNRMCPMFTGTALDQRPTNCGLSINRVI